MEAHVDIGGSEVLELKGALLVYRGRSRGFVTWHQVCRGRADGAPFLGEAQELTTEFVNHLAQGLGTRIPTEILPENILVRTAESIVWWTAAKVRVTGHDLFRRYSQNIFRLISRIPVRPEGQRLTVECVRAG